MHCASRIKIFSLKIFQLFQILCKGNIISEELSVGLYFYFQILIECKCLFLQRQYVWTKNLFYTKETKMFKTTALTTRHLSKMKIIYAFSPFDLLWPLSPLSLMVISSLKENHDKLKLTNTTFPVHKSKSKNKMFETIKRQKLYIHISPRKSVLCCYAAKFVSFVSQILRYWKPREKIINVLGI